jgi:HD-GYP domain-containing protein (c-di-GMP phosphodiesterase class II)
MFTVVDHFDALSSDRPYRAAWPREKAIVYLEENSGVIFDPRVVSVFLGLLAENAFEIEYPR